MSARNLMRGIILALPILVAAPSHAQDAAGCDVLDAILEPNVSSTLEIPALRVDYLGSAPYEINIANESFQWRLEAAVYPPPRQSEDDADAQEVDSMTVVWLNTEETNTTRLGGDMRMCHNFVPLQAGRSNVTWSHQTLERSVQDTGDCRALVSEACLDALESQYRRQATQQWSEFTACQGGNTSVPWECLEAGMVAPISRPNPDFNDSLISRIPISQTTNLSTIPLQEDGSLVCGNRNFSREFGTIASLQNYDLATNFPIMDIMTFFPTLFDSGAPQNPMRMYRVQIACLVPGQVTEGSREKAGVDEVLGRYNSTGGNQTAEQWRAGEEDGESAGMSAYGCGTARWVVVGSMVLGLAGAIW